MKKIIFTTLTTLSLHPAFANNAAIETGLSQFQITNMQISDSPISGLRQVISDQGIFYASPDGKYVMQGSIFELTDKGPVDISNRPLMKKLESLSSEMIVFPAKNEKYVVNVFTDVTCPYCLKLHKDIPDYNAKGITIRYLAFPRAGSDSQAAGQMESIWTASDPKAAFSEAEKTRKLPNAKKPHIVSKQFDLGVLFNVNGTPALVLEDGTMIPGYQTPNQLLDILEKK